MQFSLFVFSRPPRDLSHLPPVEALKAFKSMLEDATRAMGKSVILFEDPDATSVYCDTDIVLALNKKIKTDPNYPLPEGFTKITEKELVLSYQIPAYIKIKPVRRMCVEFLDALLFNAVGIHFIEPVVSYETTVKVRPLKTKPVQPEREPLAYMKQVNRSGRTHLEALTAIPSQKTQSAKTSPTAVLKKHKEERERRPKVTPEMKVEIAQFPPEDRPLATEVAMILVEILEYASEGLTELPARRKYGAGAFVN